MASIDTDLVCGITSCCCFLTPTASLLAALLTGCFVRLEAHACKALTGIRCALSALIFWAHCPILFCSCGARVRRPHGHLACTLGIVLVASLVALLFVLVDDIVGIFSAGSPPAYNRPASSTTQSYQPASDHGRCKQTASSTVRTLTAAGSTGSPVQSAPVTSHTV